MQTPNKTSEQRGLKKLRDPGGWLVRAEHPEWSRPNRKAAARIIARQARAKAQGMDNRSQGYTLPGSAKKV